MGREAKTGQPFIVCAYVEFFSFFIVSPNWRKGQIKGPLVTKIRF